MGAPPVLTTEERRAALKAAVAGFDDVGIDASGSLPALDHHVLLQQVLLQV